MKDKGEGVKAKGKRITDKTMENRGNKNGNRIVPQGQNYRSQVIHGLVMEIPPSHPRPIIPSGVEGGTR